MKKNLLSLLDLKEKEITSLIKTSRGIKKGKIIDEHCILNLDWKFYPDFPILKRQTDCSYTNVKNQIKGIEEWMVSETKDDSIVNLILRIIPRDEIRPERKLSILERIHSLPLRNIRDLIAIIIAIGTFLASLGYV